MYRQLIALLFLAVAEASAAQLGPAADDQVHHVIVILDRSRSISGDKEAGHTPEARKTALQALLEVDLPDLCFLEGGVVPGRALLDSDRGDFLSVVSFGLDSIGPDFERFIQTEEFGLNYGLRYERGFDQRVFQELWGEIEGNYWQPEGQGFLGKYYSAVSFALPMSLYDLREPTPLVNRTFLVLVSDGKYNGFGDPVGEIEELRKVRVAGIPEAMSRYEAILTSYYWRKLPAEAEREGVKVTLFEVSPLARYFTVESLLEFDRVASLLRARREYRTALPLRLKPNPTFRIQRLEATLLSDSGQALARQVFTPLGSDTVVSLFIDRDQGRHAVTLSLRAWVHMGDSAYGAHVLHPFGSELQGRAGLNRRLPVVVDSPPKILYVFPLTDWMYDLVFFTESETVAVWTWRILSSLMLLFGFLLLIRRLSEIRDPRRLKLVSPP